jgi:5-(carboxyamino)imidazole ribonucleotide synthase
MLNIVGELPEAARVLEVPGAHLHLYGKSPRRGRKLGHITVVASSLDQLHARVQELRQLPGVG